MTKTPVLTIAAVAAVCFSVAAPQVWTVKEGAGNSHIKLAQSSGGPVVGAMEGTGKGTYEVGKGTVQGAGKVGTGVVKGVGCIATLGKSC